MLEKTRDVKKLFRSWRPEKCCYSNKTWGCIKVLAFAADLWHVRLEFRCKEPLSTVEIEVLQTSKTKRTVSGADVPGEDRCRFDDISLC